MTQQTQLKQLLAKLTPPAMAEVEPYTRAAIPASAVRLDAMESPYGFRDLPPELFRLWQQQLATAEVNRYPASLSQQAQQALSQLLKLELADPANSLSLSVGNGSDELIMLLMLLSGTARGAKVLSPWPSFSMYEHLTKVLGGQFIPVELEADFSLDLDKFSDTLAAARPHLVFISQPNNPSGNLFPTAAIIRAAELLSDTGLVVVDRAYEFFCQQAATLPSSTELPNLVQLGTLSKIGTAGLRFGFVLGQTELINELNKLRLPYNINSLTCLSLEFITEHLAYFQEYAARLVSARNELSLQLQQYEQLQVFPSQTNFILFRLRQAAADELYQHLAANQVLVKNLAHYHPLTYNCLRVSIGTPADNAKFLKELRKFIG